MGVVGDSNVPCQTTTSASTTSTGTNGGVVGCGSDADCLYGACKRTHNIDAGTQVGTGTGTGVGVCITPNKTCTTNVPGLPCSGHGLCQFADGTFTSTTSPYCNYYLV